MHVKEFIRQHKYTILIAVIIIAITFLWSFINSFSEDVTSSAWDGVVARNFASGTGSIDNPYVISNASEYAYFKSLLEGEDASVYVDKNYKITNSFDYGEFDIAIDNDIAFSGVIDGNGNTIYNASVTNSLFNSFSDAIIKNVVFSDLTIQVSENTGVFSKDIIDSSIFSIVIQGNVNVISTEDEFNFTGLTYNSTNSSFKNIVVNLSVNENDNYLSLVYDNHNTKIDNVLVKNGYNHALNGDDIDLTTLYEFSLNDDEIFIDASVLDNLVYDNYKVIISNNEFSLLCIKEKSETAKAPIFKSVNRDFVLHDTGRDNDTLYINDLESDYNYYMGLNYAYRDNLALPDGSNSNLYNTNNLVRVMLYYSGTETINGTDYIGEVSPSEAISNIVYYKWVPIQNNKIKIKLLDSPFSKRPNNLAFNGWVEENNVGTITIDTDTYERYITVNVSDTSDIVLNFRVSWVMANVYNITSSNPWASAMVKFYDSGIRQLDTIQTECNFDLTQYYLYKNLNRNETCTNCYYRSGYSSTYNFYDSYTCTSRYGCTVYERATTYNSSSTYYVYNNGNMRQSNPPSGSSCYDVDIPIYTNMDMGGYFVGKSFTRNDDVTGYYDVYGNLLSGTCNSNTCTYYELLTNGNIRDINTTYYYLVTRDTNIAFMSSSNITTNLTTTYSNKPFTLTAYHNGANNITTYYYGIQNGNFTIGADVAFENVRINGGVSPSLTIPTTRDYNNPTYRFINANFHNLKIGRGITRYGTTNVNAYGIIGGSGGTGSTSADTRYSLIVESGYYSIISTNQFGSASSTTNTYIEAETTLGNDIDRALEINDGLNVYNIYAATLAYNTRSSKDVAIKTILKSGRLGSAGPDASEDDSVSIGLYAGGRQYANVYAATSTKVEGGWIYNLIGSPGFEEDIKNNVVSSLYMTGGEVNNIFGGAGTSETYGNRVISVTGGKVNYSVFGGSNGIKGSNASNEQGTLTGSTFVYIGGKAQIGDATLIANNSSVYGVSSGNVFGVGNGRSGYDQIGSADNATIIIDGKSSILGSVFGSGNFGTLGYSSATSKATCNIKILNGTVSGNVYGAGNKSGSGTESVTSIINIEMTGGTVSGNIYGGSNEQGDVYGSTNVNIKSGNVSGNIYGGGKGEATTVIENVNVTIGDTTTNHPSVGGSVYGGSAFGVVNGASSTSTSSGNTIVTVNNGVITGNVFGGGQGDASTMPYVLGNITVNINNGDISSVFGGNDQAGIHNKQNAVHLNGGTIENVYGGGNKSSVVNTNVYLDGATITNIYGGSNTLGDVSTTNVDINSGTVQNVYGGNNEGGTCGITDVSLTGTAQVNGSVYGGGNQVNTTTTTVTLNSVMGSISNVYGGGNSASVTTANVINNGVNATNIFGGSNSNGTVTTSYITYNGGTSSNVYGGNNAGGNTITTNIDIGGGTITTIYGGGNQANSGTSHIDITGGKTTDIFGGGNSAGLNESYINITTGSVSNVYGGSNNSGMVDETNITLVGTTGAITAIYGGGNHAEVGDANITMQGGVVTNIYGGGNLAQVTGGTAVDINGGTINANIYGGGNFGVVRGSSNLSITDATILGSVYAGGNGSSATLEGNTNITIDGSTVIGTSSSISPISGCVFGGGNQAFTGTETANNSTSNVNIVGGTIYGNVYGGANTSVIYGNTIVNIGKTAYTSESLSKTDIYIKGNVYGGGEANASGSEIYDWSFISVTEGVNITIDADTYDNFQIDGSFYGGGNASSAEGDSYLLIRNYGSGVNPKRNVSIQRVTYVTIDNSSILLAGAIDRANDYDKELFSISRVVDFKLQNNSYLFLATGANLLESFKSLDASGNPAVVTIDEDNNTLNKMVDNRVYMYEGKNLNIAKDQQVTVYGEVTGMSFLGIFNYANGNVNTGMYNNVYNPGDELDYSLLFAKGSYVLGKHLTNHDIKINGFYSNFMNEDTLINEVKYIDPTPKDAQFYMWYIGENIIEYNVNLVASKYSTLGSVEQSFLEFSKPNTSFQIDSFDISDIASGVSLVDKNNIPRIANNVNDANNIFGLSMEASNNGWLTTGKTSFYTTEPWLDGVTYYEGENSTVVPTMLFYLYHSKNLSQEKDLGTVRITITAITKLNALSNEVKRLVVNVNMSSALFQTTEYEGAMTPGDKYDLFTSTSNNITTKSKFSAYYALYGSNTNLYKTGYHRVLTSSYVLPVGTKITMLDLALGSPEYYYHVITENDVINAQNEHQLEGECSYNLSMFTKMGSVSNSSNYDDSYMNNIYYDGTNSSEEFIFIVDFSDTEITANQLGNSLLIEVRDANDESIITVLGIQHSQLTYNLYANMDSEIDISVTPSDNPLYIGYNDIFDVVIDYESSNLSGISITDTQYFDSKLGVQIYITNSEGNLVSGTDLTGAYFLMDGVKYYPDISGYTHIKLANKVGNTEKWITFNTENTELATGSYKFTFEAFASPDGIYYSTGIPDYHEENINIINSTYGLNPVIDDDSVICSANNNKSFNFTLYYTSLLTAPNIRITMYRREYDEVYDTNYRYVDFQDFVSYELPTSNNIYEYVIDNNPLTQKSYTFPFKGELLTGTYRIVFKLYDDDTLIGEINRYIIVK